MSTPISIGTVSLAAGTGRTSATLTTIADANVGDTVLVAALLDLSPANQPTIADASGNTWAVDVFLSSSTICLFLARARITTRLASGSLIAISTSGGGATLFDWDIAAAKITDAAVSPLDVIAGVTQNSVTSMSSGATAPTAQASEIAIGVFVAYNSTALDTFTVGGSYTLISAVQCSRASVFLTLGWEYLILSSTGAQTATASVSNTTTFGAAAVATYKLGVAAPLAPGIVTSQAVKRAAYY